MSVRNFATRLCFACFAASLLVSTGNRLATAQVQPQAGMMRFPDVSADRVVFVYGEDLWIVSRDGGLAQPLAAPPGEESLPRFSLDGQTIAFVGNYDAGRDLYSIPVSGGPASRLTWHPANELLCDWTPDGRLVFATNGLAGLERQQQLFTVAADGSGEAQLPVPYGSNGAISGDGKWLAYTPWNADYRTWKRYRGGMAPDVWLFNLDTKASRRITDFAGTDTLPMWNGNSVVYLSDAGPENRLNLWSFDTTSGQRRQLTAFADHDCRWPSIGPGPAGQGEVIFQNGACLHLLDLAAGQTKALSITVPGDRPKIRPQTFDVSESISAWDISPSAKRLAVEARGDIWTLPAKNGSPRNLTHTSGVAERDPAWSPDGKWLAWFSDATGEYELMIAAVDGKSEPRKLTSDGNCYRYSPVWSPDSKWLTFSDKTGALFLVNAENGEKKQIDRDPTAGPVVPNWSHNSQWLVYGLASADRSPSSHIVVQEVATGARHQLTSGFFNDRSPVFDRKGEYIHFISPRAFNAPRYEDVGSTFIYAGTEVLMALPLRADVKRHFAPESDEETGEGTSEKKDPPNTTDPSDQSDPSDESADTAEEPEPPKPFTIDVEGAESRAFQIPVDQGNFRQLAVNHEGHLIYVRASGQGDDSEPSIKAFDPADEKREEKTVLEGKGRFVPTADGKKLLVVDDGKAWIVDAAADQKAEEPVPMAGMNATIDPRAEWAHVFNEAWRIQRDFFYDPNMHGVDWPKVREQYAALLPDCVSRRDVAFLISEMISELNVGHAYYRDADGGDNGPPGVGLPGCRLERTSGGWKIAEIWRGAAWDSDARNPLDEAGIREGQFLHAVNGQPLPETGSPWAAFSRLAGLTAVLTVSDQPAADGSERQVPVKLLASDAPLRFRAWIEKKRQRVAERTGGKVGYIYVINTGVPGQNDLVRQLYGQLNCEALIIDDRWNGGGQIPTRFIELLNRPVTNYWARRDGTDWTWPGDAHQGPKCMLINGLAGSGGDMFPALFKQNRLGKLIGMRTWGGLVGISGGPTMIDGSEVTPPTFAYYETDGTWGIEGHGVDPDIEIVDDPALMQDGGDPQLDEAIKLMLGEIETRGYKKPDRPAYPDRSKAGLRDEDK